MNRKSKQAKRFMAFRATADHDIRIRRLARQTGYSISAIIRECLNDHLHKLKDYKLGKAQLFI